MCSFSRSFQWYITWWVYLEKHKSYDWETKIWLFRVWLLLYKFVNRTNNRKSSDKHSALFTVVNKRLNFVLYLFIKRPNLDSELLVFRSGGSLDFFLMPISQSLRYPVSQDQGKYSTTVSPFPLRLASPQQVGMPTLTHWLGWERGEEGIIRLYVQLKWAYRNCLQSWYFPKKGLT